jgi:hypothetical protein
MEAFKHALGEAVHVMNRKSAHRPASSTDAPRPELAAA